MSDEEECQACGGPAIPMGTLGRLVHLRCRNCGCQQSRRLEEGESAPDMGGD